MPSLRFRKVRVVYLNKVSAWIYAVCSSNAAQTICPFRCCSPIVRVAAAFVQRLVVHRLNCFSKLAPVVATFTFCRLRGITWLCNGLLLMTGAQAT